MSNRSRGPARIIGEIKPISDANKLLWERYFNPMQAAAAQFNAAIRNTEQILAAVIIEREGFTTDTHVFDMEKMRVIPRPKAVADNGNPE